jgi:uncharacterized protein involved in exopolysaccharide biosynthesis
MSANATRLAQAEDTIAQLRSENEKWRHVLVRDSNGFSGQLQDVLDENAQLRSEIDEMREGLEEANRDAIETATAQLREKLEEVEADRRGWKSMYERSEASLAAKQVQIDEIREALERLIKRIDEVHENYAYRQAFLLFSTHVGDYLKHGGMQYVDELKVARAILAKYPK